LQYQSIEPRNSDAFLVQFIKKEAKLFLVSEGIEYNM